MNSDYTDITILLDRSGSMSGIKDSTIEGINSFIRDQQKVSGKCTLSLIQFDDRYEVNYIASSIQNAAYLTTHTYIPRGTTALRDSLSKAIDDTGQRLASLPEQERPGKVIFVVITDGDENASREISQEALALKVKNQEDVYKWKFVFMGANIDTFATAANYGVSNVRGMAVNFVATDAGVKSSLGNLSDNMVSYRNANLSVASSSTYNFWQEDDQVSDTGTK